MHSATLDAARLTLVALRSLQGENATVREDLVLLDGTSLHVAEAVKELALRPKALLCSASLSGNVLSISTSFFGSADPLLHPGLEQMIREEQESVRRAYACGRLARVLIRDGGASFVVDDTVVGLWEREYRLPGLAYMFSDERPNNHAQDADVAIVFWPVAKDRFQISTQD